MPAPKVDRALVLHVASLAALRLEDAEVDRLVTELASIIGYVEQLDSLDTKEVPPTAHVRLDRTPWRPDAPLGCLSHEDALAQAPKVDQGGYVVPTFVEW